MQIKQAFQARFEVDYVIGGVNVTIWLSAGQRKECTDAHTRFTSSLPIFWGRVTEA